MPIMISARARVFSDSDKPFAVEICRVAMLSKKLGDDAAYSLATSARSAGRSVLVLEPTVITS
jgi:hypothetical protein